MALAAVLLLLPLLLPTVAVALAVGSLRPRPTGAGAGALGEGWQRRCLPHHLMAPRLAAVVQQKQGPEGHQLRLLGLAADRQQQQPGDSQQQQLSQRSSLSWQRPGLTGAQQQLRWKRQGVTSCMQQQRWRSGGSSSREGRSGGLLMVFLAAVSHWNVAWRPRWDM